MTVDFYWRIAMEGDQVSLARPDRSRGGFAPDSPNPLAPGRRGGKWDGYTHVDYMAEVIRSAEDAGFVGGLLPSFPHTDDPWAAASALATETRTWRFMIAFQPGFLHPLQVARMSATLQASTGGRVVYNIISGGGGPEQAWWGDALPHDERYQRTSEFLDVLSDIWHTPVPIDRASRYFEVSGACLPESLFGQPFPEIFFSGSSPAAIAAASRHADFYLSWLEPLEDLATKFDGVRAASPTPPRFAVRTDILARESEEEAWEEVRSGWPTVISGQVVTGDSVGALRQFVPQADPADFRALEIQPNIWGGFDTLRSGPSFGLVGSYRQVAERLDDLIDLGVEAFVLAGTPHLEEANRVGNRVLPLLRDRIQKGP